MKYNAIYKPNQLICGTGKIAVIAGWTPKEAIAKHLHESEYAVIGNLYSPVRGINFLIRNLLANPHVRFIVGLNVTKEDSNSGSVKCLQDFFVDGVEKVDSGWKIKSNIEGFIDEEIPLETLNRLREMVNNDMFSAWPANAFGLRSLFPSSNSHLLKLPDFCKKSIVN